MLFRVAALVGRTVEQLLEEMSAEEFLEWCAFYAIEPWGFQARAWSAGVVSATVANYAGRSRKRADAKPSDFMPRGSRPKKRRQSAAEIKQILKDVSTRDG